MVGCCLLATSFCGVQSYSDIRVLALPLARNFDPMRSLATLQVYPRSQVAGAGPRRVFLLDCLPSAEGGVAVTYCICEMKLRDTGHCLALGHLSEFTDGVQGRWSAENALLPRCGGGCCPGTPPSFYITSTTKILRNRKIGVGLPTCTAQLV